MVGAGVVLGVFAHGSENILEFGSSLENIFGVGIGMGVRGEGLLQIKMHNNFQLFEFL